MTNERKLIQRIKGLEDKLDSLYAILKVKMEEETWVTGRYLIATLGIHPDDMRRMRVAGVMKSKGKGTGRKYLLQSLPDHIYKKKEASDKTSLSKNDQ